jgi:hypothetical protein
MQEMRCTLPDWSLRGQEGLREPGAGYEDRESLPLLPDEQFKRDVPVGVSGLLAGRSDTGLSN